MKKEPNDLPDSADEMRGEYDFRGGVRGKYAARYAARYAAGTNVVLLDPDVAAVSHDTGSVNRALPRNLAKGVTVE